jgi:hypothetical protein
MYSLERAYVMSGDPKLLLLLARGYTAKPLLCARAWPPCVTTWTLAGAPDAEVRDRIGELLARIEPNVASLTITCDRRSAVVELDGERLGRCPFTRSLPVKRVEAPTDPRRSRAAMRSEPDIRADRTLRVPDSIGPKTSGLNSARWVRRRRWCGAYSPPAALGEPVYVTALARLEGDQR